MAAFLDDLEFNIIPARKQIARALRALITISKGAEKLKYQAQLAETEEYIKSFDMETLRKDLLNTDIGG